MAAYIVGLLGVLDIAADINPKTRVFPPYDFDAVATGDIEIGFASITEILADPRVKFLGPLPSAIQSYTAVAAGIVASGQEQETARHSFDLFPHPLPQRL